MIAVPLIAEKETIGILYSDDFKPKEFDRSLEESILLLATQSALARFGGEEFVILMSETDEGNIFCVRRASEGVCRARIASPRWKNADLQHRRQDLSRSSGKIHNADIALF